MHNFNSKVAAITGAGSGIGRALAINLAKGNCHLALADLNASALAETADFLKEYPIRVTTQELDVANRDEVYAWADNVVEQHGKVNLIFNNAGVALSGTVYALSIEDYEWIMDINFWGVMYGTKAFLRHLEKSGDGHVINISSTFGLSAQPFMSGYNASKFAVRGVTESLRQDLEISKSCVSATCVHPGGIKTNIAQSSRMSCSVEEVTGVSQQAMLKDFERSFITTPDRAAKVILKGVLKNKRRILIGGDARVYDLIVRLFPASYQWLFTKVVAWRGRSLSEN